MTLTKNTDKLRQEVAAHVAADSIVQGIYWNIATGKGCFIGCLAKSDGPTINEVTYGLPEMLQRIAENIFEALPANEAKAFFAALPDAVACDGKDLTKVGWQFLATELRSLPTQPAEIQAVIDPVIAGMDLLASGQEWPAAEAAAEVAEAEAQAEDDWAEADWAVTAAVTAAWAAADAARAAAAAAAGAAGAAAARAAVRAAAARSAAAAAAWAARAAAARAAVRAAAARSAVRAAAWAAVRLRQRDLLLRLIAEAPVVENHQ